MDTARDLPLRHVERSLDLAERFVRRIMPVIDNGFEEAKVDIRRKINRGGRHSAAEAQGFPGFVRVRIHQSLVWFNDEAAKNRQPIVHRRHIRNVALCLVNEETEMRLLRDSRRYRTHRSGRHQERLVTQAAYWEHLRRSEQALVQIAPPFLNALTYYVVDGFDFKGVMIVIPNGFNLDGTVCVAEERFVPLEESLDFDERATFAPRNSGDVLLGEPVQTEDLTLEFGLGSEADPYPDDARDVVESPYEAPISQPSLFDQEGLDRAKGKSEER